MKKKNISGTALSNKEQEYDLGTRDTIVNHLITEMSATARLIVALDDRIRSGQNKASTTENQGN
jgi:hypothetical protein